MVEMCSFSILKRSKIFSELFYLGPRNKSGWVKGVPVFPSQAAYLHKKTSGASEALSLLLGSSSEGEPDWSSKQQSAPTTSVGSEPSGALYHADLCTTWGLHFVYVRLNILLWRWWCLSSNSSCLCLNSPCPLSGQWPGVGGMPCSTAWTNV